MFRFVRVLMSGRYCEKNKKEKDDSGLVICEQLQHTLLKMEFCCKSSLLQRDLFIHTAEKRRGREVREMETSGRDTEEGGREKRLGLGNCLTTLLNDR